MPLLQYEVTCSAAPLQIEGTFGPTRFYFRARDTEWTFLATDKPGVDPCDLPNYDASARSGLHENASYMPLRDGLRIIRECLSAYRRGSE